MRRYRTRFIRYWCRIVMLFSKTSNNTPYVQRNNKLATVVASLLCLLFLVVVDRTVVLLACFDRGLFVSKQKPEPYFTS